MGDFRKIAKTYSGFIHSDVASKFYFPLDGIEKSVNFGICFVTNEDTLACFRVQFLRVCFWYVYVCYTAKNF